MPVSLLGTQTVQNFPTEATSRTLSTHTVTAGTDTLLVLIQTRTYDSSFGPDTWDIKWNGVSLAVDHNAFDDLPKSAGRVGTLIAYLHAPASGNLSLTIDTPTMQRGLIVAAYNLDGNKVDGSPIGALAFQRSVASVQTSVSLSITAQATSADNAIFTALMIAQNTTTTSFEGTGYTDDFTGQFGNFPHGTIRRKLGAIGTVTAGATWAGSTTGFLGGMLFEVLAASEVIDDAVSETVTADASVSFVEPSTAKRTDLSFWQGRTAWTYLQVFEPVSAADDRSWIRIGTATEQMFAVRGRINNGQGSINVYRCSYSLSDGTVITDTDPSSQVAGPAVLAVVHEAGFGGRSYLQGLRQSNGYRSGQTLAGGLQLAGALEIGAHAGAAPAPTEGKLARVMIDAVPWSEAKVALISRAILEPGSVYGIGDEETAAEILAGAARSPVALPMSVSLAGAPSLTFEPEVADPDDSDWAVTAVSGPGHGMVEIAGARLIRYTPDPGYTGNDSFSYVVTGAGKSSTGRVAASMSRPSLVANPDSFQVTRDSSNFLYDPLANDVLSPGAIISAVSDPPNGTASIEPGGLKVRYTPTPGYTGSDSFQYTLTDAFQSRTATVSVTVSAPATQFANAANDSATTTKGNAVDIAVLANDTGSSGLQVISVTDPPNGVAAIVSGGSAIRYTPDAGFVGTDSFQYTAQLVGGTASDNATVSVSVTDTPSASAGWGSGPKSGFAYHLGGRMGNWPTFTNANQATALGRPNHPDIQDNWIDYAKMPTTTPEAWKWISGCDPAQNADDHTQIGGVFTVGQWNLAYSASRTQQICKFNVALNPPGLSTKLSPGEALGEKWRFWFDLAAGNYDVHFRRLGKRFAYKDATAGRQVGTDPSHFAPGRVLPRGANLVVLGWEVNDSQRWAYFGHRSPSTASAASPHPINTYCYTKVGDGLARIINAWNAGYESYAGKRCPYLFGTRPTSRCQAGKRYRDVLWTWPDASLCKWVGQSAHHSEQACTPSNPNGIWFDVPGATAGTWSREGLNSIGELATRHGWKVYLDETAQHFAGPFAQYSNARADLFWRSIHNWFVANPSLAGGVSFYQGDSYTGANGSVCNTSLITNPDPGGPYSTYWAEAKAVWLDIYKA